MVTDLKSCHARLILGLIIVVSACSMMVYSCGQSDTSEMADAESITSGHPGFVGKETCQSCHAEQTSDWLGSHHDYAMKPANEQSVRGDFGDVSFTHRGDTYRFFREDSLFMVQATGPDGEPVRYRVTHTFGWEPLQQYLVDFGKGKLQALNIAWDTRRQLWFALNPEQDLAHGDWMHWTGGAMNWNTMCADCHSTNLRQNYIAAADSFHTTWSEINVSCEACHGPGQAHVEFMKSGKARQATIERIRSDLALTAGSSQEAQISQCAQCHALREELNQSYDHSGDFLDHFNLTLPHPEAYFGDGQIKEEVYVWGSFLQSKMFKKGVQCTDCHDPHTLELKANVTDNTLCMQCHQPRYNTPDHHMHQVGTEAAQCISCHMPGRYYMEVDFRRDHSFRVPRPDLSAKFGTPNSCNNCHSDQSAEWAADAVEDWYGSERPDHYSEVWAEADSLGADALSQLKALIADTSQNDIARATGVWYLGQMLGEESAGILEQALSNASPLIRNTAARTLATYPSQMKIALQDVLNDSLRAVRLAAAEGLAEFTTADITFNLKQAFSSALEEYRTYLDANQYFPQGQMNRGQFFEKRGETGKAIDAYQKALAKDSLFHPARLNLAYLYNQQGQNRKAARQLRTVIELQPENGPAHYSLALLLAEQNRLQETLPLFEEAARLMPDHARLRYNWAIALQRLNAPEKAEQAYLEAIERAPENVDFLYGICTLYIQQEQYERALPHARRLVELQPRNQRFNRLLQTVKKGLN